MTLEAGTKLGPYEIKGPLGAGGMGEVYRAHDTRLGRDAALKILPDLFASDPERRARFDREAKALAALNHPNIAQVADLGRDGRLQPALELEGRSAVLCVHQRPDRGGGGNASSAGSRPRTPARLPARPCAMAAISGFDLAAGDQVFIMPRSANRTLDEASVIVVQNWLAEHARQ